MFLQHSLEPRTSGLRADALPTQLFPSIVNDGLTVLFMQRWCSLRGYGPWTSGLQADALAARPFHTVVTAALTVLFMLLVQVNRLVILSVVNRFG